ncbi:Nucleoside epimerase [Candidatus Rhodobacter oscarellae]|uniref:Nucleoside epimerase n=1 Tax=Candidatus Rhodobacter oscarellae TaxID=1675527 RepID=A0A0J9EBL0_9RHOB|nr:epimerase [Candidatus Rhodobacter lobularis]KMW60137.1 Nucleoside epimerase [Candidatus Rhodobacter lobularis]
MTRTVLILGASGRFGRNAAQAFAARGWQVRRFDRSTDDLHRAARGADVIVNAWNPQYPDWQRQLPAITQQVIAAAKPSGSTVIIPGNVYVYGADAPERFAPDTPHRATNRLGRLRIEMEAAYRAAGVRTIILRAGDFLDTEASGNWFDMAMAKRAARGTFTYPGAMDRAHAWAYLPDLARAAVGLAGMRDRLDMFEDVTFPGYTLTGAELGAAVNAVTPVRVTQMSWWPLVMASPFWPLARYLREMRYLWNKPHHLDAARFDALLPGFQHTPVQEAVARALEFQVNPDQMVAQPAT